ncbi:nucleotidyl transferase AbiEii/AbiGii toxin family protein [bacterium]|nr:nucleotidyl transferase AbiEii/AbiGii toxin family protein [bacterium]
MPAARLPISTSSRRAFSGTSRCPMAAAPSSWPDPRKPCSITGTFRAANGRRNASPRCGIRTWRPWIPAASRNTRPASNGPGWIGPSHAGNSWPRKTTRENGSCEGTPSRLGAGRAGSRAGSQRDARIPAGPGPAVGTALRFLHGLPRFSEDLDFSIVSADRYAGPVWMAKLKRDLALAGFSPEVTWNERRTVHTGWVRLHGILQEAGLSPLANEKLAIKVEVDTQPPGGGRCERQIVTRHLSFLLQYHDLSSLMAGKIHALLTRRYAKGRDWYDLVWYLSQRPPVAPNLALLENALAQTQGVDRPAARDWMRTVKNRLLKIDVPALADDVGPFLERPQDANLITRENLLRLLPDLLGRPAAE